MSEVKVWRYTVTLDARVASALNPGSDLFDIAESRARWLAFEHPGHVAAVYDEQAHDYVFRITEPIR